MLPAFAFVLLCLRVLLCMGLLFVCVGVRLLAFVVHAAYCVMFFCMRVCVCVALCRVVVLCFDGICVCICICLCV